MNNYLDLSKYTDAEVISMLKDKQREYMLLIQSEKVAKMILDNYGEELYISKYHLRVNNEYYLIHERVIKKNLLPDNSYFDNNMEIPILAVISRLEESREELRINNNPAYLPYSRHIVVIIDEIKEKLNDITIQYKDGYLYLVKEDNAILLTEDALNNLLDDTKKKTL